MLRITNIIPIYRDGDNTVSYSISLDNSINKNSVSANLVLQPNEIDLSPILDVCKKTLEQTVSDD